MATMSEQIQATFKARDILVERFGGPADLDLVEILGDALANNNKEHQELVFTVAQQRADRRAQEGAS